MGRRTNNLYSDILWQPSPPRVDFPPIISPPNAAEIIASLPPMDFKNPSSANDADADAHNAAVLAVRGIQTTATGIDLYVLAGRALNNSPIGITPKTPFTPFYFFFYGSLQIPEVINCVCALPEDSLVLRTDASLKGWKVRMWGAFPALVPACEDDDPVKGVAWLCEHPEQVARLCEYETDAYRMAYCSVTLPREDGEGDEVVEDMRTFVSTLEPDQLAPGEFDRDAYMKRTGWGP
ncbi:hypothetical protein F5B22DRAFT_650432 [Xylaria bambusicola]|uniref:uncharacterized protein n=1 Tax=Xylaria bambusicola TaxID=326684 RepID=UPI002008AF4A|nr:uncharacterized protein F5B22DRAFT_650432 [Xylaria bambusicola]KAI0506785.1 hypothetical protein F5B22DRAFT_650432 [Xylaria bambusicola]